MKKNDDITCKSKKKMKMTGSREEQGFTELNIAVDTYP
jgi:hypothetical protein